MDMCSKCYREVNSAQKRDVTEMQTETQSAEATSAVNLENTASVCDAVERSVVTPARTEIASRAGDEHEVSDEY